ncbi:MAG: hypothetical protein OXE53_07300 [Deltaproteobacteria bacterium]|nr:hypothetical protein [Deltaproteobacteria bacterium]
MKEIARDLVIAVAAVLLLASCTSVASTKLTSHSAKVFVRATDGWGCGAACVQRIAMEQASVVTIRCGFDRFLVQGTDSGVATIGGQYGGSASVEEIIFDMYLAAQAPESALDARAQLGEDWEEIVEREEHPVTGC